MVTKLMTREGRSELWRRWEGIVPNEAFKLVPALFDLIDEREDEIQRLRRERDTLGCLRVPWFIWFFGGFSKFSLGFPRCFERFSLDQGSCFSGAVSLDSNPPA